MEIIDYFRMNLFYNLKYYMMKRDIYSAPRCEVSKAKLRASILAGSTKSTGVEGHDLDWGNGARERKVSEPLTVSSVD